MNHLKSIFLASLMISISVSSNALAANKIGTTVNADRTVTANGSRVLKQNATLFENDNLRSNRTGLAHLKFNDGTKMVVGPNARIKLDEAVYSSGNSTFSKFVINQTAGAMRFISGDSKSSSYTINTPTGSIGVRGTAFDTHVIRGRTFIMLIEGNVTFCNGSGNCVTIGRKCDCAIINVNGSIVRPFNPKRGIFSKSDMARFFPFIHDQDDILAEFQKRIATCASGSNDPTISGSSNGDGSTGGGTGGGANGGTSY